MSHRTQPGYRDPIGDDTPVEREPRAFKSLKFYAGVFAYVGGAILVGISLWQMNTNRVLENDRLIQKVDSTEKKVDRLQASVDKMARQMGIDIAKN